MRTVIGIDYGTQSARAVLVDAGTGQVLCSHSIAYPHGVMAGDLASAQDYEAALLELMERVILSEYSDTVAGICVDATSLTLVPVSVDQALEMPRGPSTGGGSPTSGGADGRTLSGSHRRNHLQRVDAAEAFEDPR